MHTHTHTHFPHPWIWSLHMFALCTYPSKPKYTLRHKHTPSPHQSIPMLLQLSTLVELLTIHYLSISPNGWIIHYNSRNDNQLCVINMNIIHTHHTKPTTPCTYLSFGTYASGDEIHVLLRCEFSKSPWHTSKHRRGIVALYYIDCCCRRWLRTRSRKLISKFINCKFSDNHEICTLLLLILSLLSYGK